MRINIFVYTMSVQEVLEGIITPDQFFQGLLSTQSKVTQIDHAVTFLADLDQTLNSHLATLHRQLTNTHQLQSNLLLMSSFQEQSCSRTEQQLSKELQDLNAQLGSTITLARQFLEERAFVPDLQEPLREYREEERVKTALKMLQKLQECNRVDVPAQLATDLPIESQVALAIILQECSKNLPRQMKKGRENAKLLLNEVKNRVLLSLKEGLLQNYPKQVQVSFELSFKLRIENAALEYLKLLVGDIRLLYLSHDEHFQLSLKESFDTLSTTLKAGLSSHNEKVRCSCLFGSFAASAFKQMLMIVLTVIIRPSLHEGLRNLSRVQRMTKLGVMMRHTRNLMQNLVEHDRDHLLQDFGIDWQLSSIFDSSVTQYQIDEQKEFRDILEKRISLLLKELASNSNPAAWFSEDIRLNTRPSRDQLKQNIQRFRGLAMSEHIQAIFQSLKEALSRNQTICKLVNQGSNARSLLKEFLESYVALLQKIVLKVQQFIPALNRSTPVEPSFFDLISIIISMKARAASIYFDCQAIKGTQNSVIAHQAFTRIDQSISKCITEALASILVRNRNIFKDLSPDDLQVYIQQTAAQEPSILARSMVTCNQPYAKEINRISSHEVSEGALQSWADQFLQFLTGKYAGMKIRSVGFSQLGVDIRFYEQFLGKLKQQGIMHKFEQFKGSIQLLKHGKKEVVKQFKKKLKNKELT